MVLEKSLPSCRYHGAARYPRHGQLRPIGDSAGMVSAPHVAAAADGGAADSDGWGNGDEAITKA
jgi:hypothetical protein